MDGDFEITIESLLHKWLSENYSLPSETKWVHQLDFSTSGCLVVALHRAAARTASLAFEQRWTYKEYLAIVEGSMDISRFEISRLSSRLEEEKKTFQRRKTPKRRPGDEVKTWQDLAIQRNVDEYLKLLNQFENKEEIGDENKKKELSRLLEISREEYFVNNKARKELRKFLKRQGFPLPVQDTPLLASQCIAKEDSSSSLLAEKTENTEKKKKKMDPLLYRLPSTPMDQFYCNLPIAEVPNSFLMQAADEDDKEEEYGEGEKRTTTSGQWSETLVHVLERGLLYQGREVTKLRLVPLTGRRHQLRVHCAALGYPIVGDATYSYEMYEERCEAAERMMLHAHILHLPLCREGKEKEEEVESGVGRNRREEEGLRDENASSVIMLQAPDPFICESVEVEGEEGDKGNVTNRFLRVSLPAFLSRSSKQ